MKTFFKFGIGLMFLAVALTGCNKDDENKIPDLFGGELWFGVKTGKIVYQNTNWYGSSSESETQTVIFDDNGKRMRVETEESVIIYDAIAEKAYILSPSEQLYTESAYHSYATAMFIYLGDDANSVWKLYPGFSKKADRTIAGKKCSVYSWSEDDETYEWGGWNRITFWIQSYKGSPETDDCYRLEATSFTETIPANSFTVPSNYTKY